MSSQKTSESGRYVCLKGTVTVVLQVAGCRIENLNETNEHLNKLRMRSMKIKKNRN